MFSSNCCFRVCARNAISRSGEIVEKPFVQEVLHDCNEVYLPTYGLCSFAKEQSVSKYNSRQITLFSSLYSSIFLYLSLSRYLYIALSLSLSLYLYLYLPLSLSLVLFDFIFISSSALNLSLFLYHSLCVFLSRHFKF